MGKINGVFESENHAIGSLLFGDNEFRTETLTVAADSSIGDGTVLTRDSDTGKLVAASTATGALFILCNEVNTPFTTAGDYPVRVVISGRVDLQAVLQAVSLQTQTLTHFVLTEFLQWMPIQSMNRKNFLRRKLWTF